MPPKAYTINVMLTLLKGPLALCQGNCVLRKKNIRDLSRDVENRVLLNTEIKMTLIPGHYHKDSFKWLCRTCGSHLKLGNG